MGNPSRFHLHDVEYDPWANRIWVSSGDTPDNSAIYYSDDLGDTWEKIRPEPRSQPTNIVALPDRVVFGTDDVPNGVKVWYRDPYENSKPVANEDIKVLYTPDKFGINEEGLWMVANNSRTRTISQLSKYPYDLVLFYEWDSTKNNEKYPNRLLASPDGEFWFEIFRVDGDLAGGTSSSVVGPVQNDPEKKIFFTHYHQSIGSHVYKITMPDWIKLK